MKVDSGEKFLKIFSAVFFVTLFLLASNSHAAERPSCILMKFTDDTRYDAINSAQLLSELVLEKMSATKKFNLKETEPIDSKIEERLYNEKVDDFKAFNDALASGNFNTFFEGDGFSEKKAQSITSAQLGQILTPELTQEIGQLHGAEYLIQGTIINLGSGNWWNEDLSMISGALTSLAAASASAVSSVLNNALGNFGGIDIEKNGIGVQCDVRIIKADTGEIIWNKRVVGVGESSMVSFGFVSVGARGLNENLYTKAMNKAAEKIVTALVADMEKNQLFVK